MLSSLSSTMSTVFAMVAVPVRARVATIRLGACSDLLSPYTLPKGEPDIARPAGGVVPADHRPAAGPRRPPASRSRRWPSWPPTSAGSNVSSPSPALVRTICGPPRPIRASSPPSSIISAADERLLIAFAAEAGRRPEEVMRAIEALGGPRRVGRAVSATPPATAAERPILCRDCLAPAAARARALSRLRLAAGGRSRGGGGAGHRPCRLRRLLRLRREARRSRPARQPADRRRVGAARGGGDLLLSRAHLRRALGHADGAGACASVPKPSSFRPTWRNTRASAARSARSCRA